jgi:hypothetical protein
MFDIQADQIVPIANVIGLGLLGILAAFGHRWGKNQPTPAEKTMEVAGAIVDNGAVRELAAALRAHTAELAAGKTDSDRARQAVYRLIEVGSRIVDELSEMRREIGDLAKEIARSK